MLDDALNKITGRLAAWQRSYHGTVSFLQLAAVTIGLLSGAGAALLKGGVDWVTRGIFSVFRLQEGNFEILFLPIIGILLATAFTRYVVRHKMDHASERISAGMANGDVDLSAKCILGPIIACSITLGMGGSAGAEDPIVYTGGAVGSNVGKAFRLDKEQLTNLVGCGAAAAIAGIFMAPIGGVMFAFEVLKMKQSLPTVIALVVSSLVAAITCYILLGCHYDVTFVPEMTFDNHMIPLVLLCGMVCGAYSIYYALVLKRCRKLFTRLNNIWVKALIGGAILAALLYIFPSLYGEGYDTLRHLMDNQPRTVVAYGPLYDLGAKEWVLMLLIVGLLAAKPFATSATNDSGGIGGDFTPTLYCGGVLGFLFAITLNYCFHMHLQPALFAYFGMAAVMAGAIQAPLMAIFITSEMAGLYGFILPLAISACISWLASRLILGRLLPDDEPASPTPPTAASPAAPAASASSASANPPSAAQ